eukprot:315777-Pyramimonas_sp.AAC.1
MVIHAPYRNVQGRLIDAGAVQRWWEETTAIAFRTGVDRIAADTNARLGSVTSSSVGSGGSAGSEHAP